MMPSTFWLVTTYSCNDRCSVCYAAADCCVPMMLRGDGHNIMPIGYAREVMDEMRDCGAENCLLIGGEPTLYPHLLEVIRYGHNLGLKMKLVSNGRRLVDRRFVDQLKEAGLVHASVSIEASSAELHDRITKTAGFQERIAGLRNLIVAGVSHNVRAYAMLRGCILSRLPAEVNTEAGKRTPAQCQRRLAEKRSKPEPHTRC